MVTHFSGKTTCGHELKQQAGQSCPAMLAHAGMSQCGKQI